MQKHISSTSCMEKEYCLHSMTRIDLYAVTSVCNILACLPCVSILLSHLQFSGCRAPFHFLASGLVFLGNVCSILGKNDAPFVSDTDPAHQSNKRGIQMYVPTHFYSLRFASTVPISLYFYFILLIFLLPNLF